MRCLPSPRSRGMRSTHRLGVPDLQVLGVQPHRHLLPDQPAVHRVDVVARLIVEPLVTRIGPTFLKLSSRAAGSGRRSGRSSSSRSPPGVQLREQLPRKLS